MLSASWRETPAIRCLYVGRSWDLKILFVGRGHVMRMLLVQMMMSLLGRCSTRTSASIICDCVSLTKAGAHSAIPPETRHFAHWKAWQGEALWRWYCDLLTELAGSCRFPLCSVVVKLETGSDGGTPTFVEPNSRGNVMRAMSERVVALSAAIVGSALIGSGCHAKKSSETVSPVLSVMPLAVLLGMSVSGSRVVVPNDNYPWAPMHVVHRGSYEFS